MQWTQVYAPIGGSLGVSAIAAAIPIIVLFIMLGALRKPAWAAATAALISALVVALAVYHMPVRLAVISTLYGAAYGLFPIAWIVFASKRDRGTGLSMVAGVLAATLVAIAVTRLVAPTRYSLPAGTSDLFILGWAALSLLLAWVARRLAAPRP